MTWQRHSRQPDGDKAVLQQVARKVEGKEEALDRGPVQDVRGVSRLLRDPRLARPANVVQRAALLWAGQQILGNQALQRMVQVRRNASPPDDEYEGEADRVVQATTGEESYVMHGKTSFKPTAEAAAATAHAARAGGPDSQARQPGSPDQEVQRQVEEEEEEEKQVQTQPLPGPRAALPRPPQDRPPRGAAGLFIQRGDGGGTATLPPTPEFHLPTPSLLEPPPQPFSNIRLEIPPLTLGLIDRQLDPASVRRGLLQLRLGPMTTPSGGPGVTPPTTPPAPSGPAVPAGAGPERPREASPSDLLNAVVAVPAIDAALANLRTLARDRARSDWRRLSTGERIAAITTSTLIAGGALAGIMANPQSRQWALSQLGGRVFPVPGVPGLSAEFNPSGENWLVGLHLDLGALLLPSMGFGPSSPTSLTERPGAAGPSGPPTMRQVDEESIHTAPHGASVELARGIGRQRGAGRPLDPAVLQALGPHFGYDLGSVRVHTGPEADRLSREVAAQAFTTGADIFFSAGKYRPESGEGQRLLAHELAHVVQQEGRTGTGTTLEVSSPGDTFEQEADRAAEAVIAGGERGQTLSRAPASIQRVPARFGPYAPETYRQLFAIARVLCNDLRQRLDEVPETETVYRQAMEWISGVDAWEGMLGSRGEEELSEAVGSQVTLWWQDLQQLRDDIQAYKRRRIVEQLGSARSSVSGAAARFGDPELRAQLDEATRAAFMKNDPDAMGQVMNFVGNVTDIGLGLQELSRDMASAIADARGTTIPEASRYTRWLGHINRVLAAANLLYSLTQMQAPTELGTAFNQVGTLAGAFSAGGTLLGLAPHIGLYANLYLVPAVTIICTRLSAILDRHLHNLNVVASATGFSVDFSNEPGGWPLFDFMYAVMGAGGPEGVPFPVPGQVESFLLSHRETISRGTRTEEGRTSEMPTTGWWFWRSLDRGRIQEWVFQQRQTLWAMFYGRTEVPRPDQIVPHGGSRR